MIWAALAVGTLYLIYSDKLLSSSFGAFISFLALFLGIYLLLKSADYLIEGAVSISERFGVSKLFIGLSLVAFGTSAPELAVSIVAAVKGHGGIAISNVVGSNVANILLCLSIAALLTRVSVSESTKKLELPFLLIVSISFASMLFRSERPSIVWNDGVVLLSFLTIFTYYLFRMARADMEELEGKEEEDLRKAVLLTVLGLVGVSLGGEMTVGSVVDISKVLGLSESFFALTIVAVGTSLPELVTSVTAVRRGHHDLSVGNIVGSNVFNILTIIGISSLVGRKLVVDVPMFYVDTSFLIGSVVILMVFSKGGSIGRWKAISMLSLYVIFLSFVILRG